MVKPVDKRLYGNYMRKAAEMLDVAQSRYLDLL